MCIIWVVWFPLDRTCAVKEVLLTKLRESGLGIATYMMCQLKPWSCLRAWWSRVGRAMSMLKPACESWGCHAMGFLVTRRWQRCGCPSPITSWSCPYSTCINSHPKYKNKSEPERPLPGMLTVGLFCSGNIQQRDRVDGILCHTRF
jgi:hypothetical protein